jgi:predicted sulfurtransferase
MKNMIHILKTAAAGFALCVLLTVPYAAAADIGLISIDQLNRSLGDDNLIILDVRTGRDWSASEFKIKGAVRADPSDFNHWSSSLEKGKTVVLYCA